MHIKLSISSTPLLFSSLHFSSSMAVPLETRSSTSKIRAPQKAEKPATWSSFFVFLSCKHHMTVVTQGERRRRRLTRTGWPGSLRNLRESSKVMQRPEPSPHGSYKTLGIASSSSAAIALGGSSRRMQIRRFSGCYDPETVASTVPSLRWTNVFACSRCGETFTKSGSLELHQATKHAVSVLGHEDNSRNIVEIILKSSWLEKQVPVCKIDRILKVHNSQKTITRFERYRDSIKSRADKKHARCVADGNELMRFHSTSIACSLGLNGSTNLCLPSSNCGACSIIRHGFNPDVQGRILTMATSGGAHDVAGQVPSDGGERAMLVCRVIAGRVSRNRDGLEECDSVAGGTGVDSGLDELAVFDPEAILPCFVVIYRGF